METGSPPPKKRYEPGDGFEDRGYPPREITAAERRRRWHDDTDAAGEPTEVRTYDRKPARYYAPPGQCTYCDRRREAARRSMAAVRERGTDA